MKLWSGMLSGELDKVAEEFNKSIDVDKRIVYEDIEGSIAHVSMLGECGILEEDEVKIIIEGLKEISNELKSGKLHIESTYEDIHSFVEDKLIEKIGELGKKMHTARSRNDQVATDFRLNLRKEQKEIIGLLKSYIKSITSLSKKNTHTIMPGFTHLQAAQPITYAHEILSYAFMATRDIERLEDFYKRLNQSPLGACALATTTYPIDRKFVASKLGFDSIMENSIDAVSDRDFCLEFHSILAQIMVHLSRFCEEIIIFSSQAYKFINIDDKFSTGSSIMPQKKNPDMAELIRGKSAKVIGNMNQAFIMVKGLSLSYSKDLQEDKESLFESIDTIKTSLKIMSGMLDSLSVNKEKMYEQAQKGYINATDLADYLVGKGLAFRDCHHISAKIVEECIKKDIGLEELPLEEYKKYSKLFENDLYDKINLLTCVKNRKVLGGPNPDEVLRQIKYLEDIINK